MVWEWVGISGREIDKAFKLSKLFGQLVLSIDKIHPFFGAASYEISIRLKVSTNGHVHTLHYFSVEKRGGKRQSRFSRELSWISG